MLSSIHPTVHATNGSAASQPTTPTTTPAAGAASGSSGSSASTAVAGTTLGGTDFLTLMLAQLKNQDPTSPVDSNTFLNQLAELSQVQGITQLNTSFTNLSNSLVSNQAMQASSLLGRTALVPSSSVDLATNGASITGAVAVPQNSSQVLVNVTNSSGQVVQQVNLGAQASGISNFTWDGTLADGTKAPAGQYGLTAQVAGVSTGTKINTYVNGVIDSVTMGSGTTGMSVDVAGQGPVALSNVLQISP
jgi:flagellar basal-body rod modification protein FlgD